MLWSLAVLGFLFASAQGRAVNISNTWVLPEEGFPVFYRYFRDRISWYEADAVCQFHHANLVTVDTTAQYDAVRAYLKELDISSAVWVGLIRSNPDGDFTWTDYRGLSGDGYWSSAPDPRSAPLCAAADPAADYRWEARACGGPTVASFICELPVPQWALGNEGCMVRALPALTVLYLPESAAVQLTADCGLAGVKRVQCTGNVKHEDLLKGLSCAEDEELTTQNSGVTSGTPLTSSESVFTEQDLVTDVTTEDSMTTEHEDDINQSSTSKPVIPYITRPITFGQINEHVQNKATNVYSDKNINLDVSVNNNLQSNVIPKLAHYDNYLTSELSEKLEDEKHMQHKLLHDEIARHGNFETIFTQPTDHFVPPLVMAKAKISDDMTVLSLEEKHAQQIAEQRNIKHSHTINNNINTYDKLSQNSQHNIEKLHISDAPLITTTASNFYKDNIKKDAMKTVMPKKYVEKQYGQKNKVLKATDFKTPKSDKTGETYSTIENKIKNLETTTVSGSKKPFESDDEPTIDLTVIIKETSNKNNRTENVSVPKIQIIENDTSVIEPEIKLGTAENISSEVTQEISIKLPTKSIDNLTLTHEVIKITIINEEDSSDIPTVFEVTTKMPLVDNNFETTSNPIINHNNRYNYTNSYNSTQDINTTQSSVVSEIKYNPEIITHINIGASTIKPTELNTEMIDRNSSHIQHITISTDSTIIALSNSTENNDEIYNSTIIPNLTIIDEDESRLYTHVDDDANIKNMTDGLEPIDDFQSPLLSGANEPVHRPNRSRRPQQLNRVNKFNPFRILG